METTSTYEDYVKGVAKATSFCYNVLKEKEKGRTMKYMVNNLETELYRLAWDYLNNKCSFETVKYMRESILSRYEETHDEMMSVWRNKCRLVLHVLSDTPW